MVGAAPSVRLPFRKDGKNMLMRPLRAVAGRVAFPVQLTFWAHSRDNHKFFEEELPCL